MLILRLYVTGHTPSSDSLVEQIRLTLSERWGDNYQLEVRDIFSDPDAAIDDQVIVTPTLMRVLPEPVRRLIGDLNDRERVLAGLQVEDDGVAS